MSNFLRFLGTGASTGIPVIGCQCAVCRSKLQKNQRLRTSSLLQWEGRKLLIDVAPDFRQQALTANLSDLDGLLITHPHYDHIAGLDELRILFLRRQTPIPGLVSSSTLEDLKRRYDYLFRSPKESANLTAQFDFQVLPAARGTVHFLGIKVGYFTFTQGSVDVTGFRFGNFAYLSDICEYPQSIFEDLRGVDVLVLSALRMKPSHVHFTIDQAIGFAQKVEARSTLLVHMDHDIDHESTERYLPESVRLSYDGMEIEL